MTNTSDRPVVTREAFDAFEWDQNKQENNLRKHGIDFKDSTRLFERPHLVVRSDFSNEERFIGIGMVDEVEIAVIYTIREKSCRIISARRARRYEREAYHQAIRRHDDQGPNRLEPGEDPDG